ncbi:hypothetical protein C4588_05810 [Candidatus Parcubacteria bacterium]|nr:MAG: hypothetical protein C4588_05810 [Candidatus Parcubacteria bacterium]
MIDIRNLNPKFIEEVLEEALREAEATETTERDFSMQATTITADEEAKLVDKVTGMVQNLFRDSDFKSQMVEDDEDDDDRETSLEFFKPFEHSTKMFSVDINKIPQEMVLKTWKLETIKGFECVSYYLLAEDGINFLFQRTQLSPPVAEEMDFIYGYGIRNSDVQHLMESSCFGVELYWATYCGKLVCDMLEMKKSK